MELVCRENLESKPSVYSVELLISILVEAQKSLNMNSKARLRRFPM